MRTAHWGTTTPPEHPSGYHGHYHKEPTPLVNREELERLATGENLAIFEKYFEATKRLEQTLISSKDFVNHSDDTGTPPLLSPWSDGIMMLLQRGAKGSWRRRTIDHLIMAKTSRDVI